MAINANTGKMKRWGVVSLITAAVVSFCANALLLIRESANERALKNYEAQVASQVAKSAKGGVVTHGPDDITKRDAWTWQRLETTSFKQYILNLRQVKCPEATIHDIVKGEIHRIYLEKIHQAMAGLTNGVEANAILKKYQEEEAAMTEELFAENAEKASDSSNSQEVGDRTNAPDSSSPTAAAQNVPPSGMPNIPIAYAPTLGSSSLTEDEINGVEAVAREFQRNVGPAPTWLGDPAYAARWEAARDAADERLRGVLGNEAYNAHAEALLKGMNGVPAKK